MENAHDLTLRANRYLICGGALTEGQKRTLTAKLLTARTSPEEADLFYRGVKYPGNIDHNGNRMYPIYFIPPYNRGKKCTTILGQTPQTHLFAANQYELEILRLLYLCSPSHPKVGEMVEGTLARLKTTCFGTMDDGIGECFDASLAVLRFLAAVKPSDVWWIRSRMDNFNRHYGEKKRPWQCMWYHWLCLTELPIGIARQELERYHEQWRNMLEESALPGRVSPGLREMLHCILHAALARIEY